MKTQPLSLVMADPATLKPNPWNPNVVSPANEDKLEKSMDELGMFKPVIVRQLENGDLEILGGEHRAGVAARTNTPLIPVINLGPIDDDKAKKISLVDNGRYGSDDLIQLAELLEGLGNVEDLASFMPYSETDLSAIFSSVSIALDDLDLPDDDGSQVSLPAERPVQTEQVMRFKVPVGDVNVITALIEATIKREKLNDKDSLRNAGDALVMLCRGLS